MDATVTAPKKRIRPLAALKALRALLSNPEDTKQVFLVIEALNGNSGRREFERFRKSAVGAAVLRERRILLDALSDQKRLATLADGTLGRAYYDFMSSEGLTADGLVEASSPERHDAMPADVRLFSERGRDSHDLQHALTGYSRDGLGEVCVLTFYCSQAWNPGLLLIAIAGTFKVKREAPGQPVFRAVWEAWRHGRKATWINGLDWEGLLGQQLEELRPRLGFRTPTTYQRILTWFNAQPTEAEAPRLAAE
jgi:ubiquinone biosynthesis protein COQ4